MAHLYDRPYNDSNDSHDPSKNTLGIQLFYNILEICWTLAVVEVVLKKKMQKVKEVKVVKEKVEEGVMVVRNSPGLCLEMLFWLKLACKPGA